MTTHPVGQAVSLRDGEQTNSSRLLTAEDLAARWRVTKSWVYAATREGHIPTVHLGRYYRYRVDAVEAFERDGGVATDV